MNNNIDTNHSVERGRRKASPEGRAPLEKRTQIRTLIVGRTLDAIKAEDYTIARDVDGLPVSETGTVRQLARPALSAIPAPQEVDPVASPLQQNTAFVDEAQNRVNAAYMPEDSIDANLQELGYQDNTSSEFADGSDNYGMAA